MATRSDFAQKLLSDLRTRKERMAVSQSSSHSTRMAGDVNGGRSQNYKGSRQIKTLESVGSRPANSQKRSSTRSVGIEESSRQLVPFGGGRNSEPIGDLSMALAFALENRGKLAILDSSGNSSVLSFLHHFGRRSLDMGKMERSNGFSMNQPSSRFPTFSHVHIKEISKGAQKLNQILRACSNSLNVDSYSIEIGRELLKGAMDLEESLRTLVNLQDASEYMISPQRKNRIRLLEEDEDDDDNTVKIVEQKQLDRPRFSFDKPSRNSRRIKEVTKTDFKQNLIMALTYPSEASNLPRKQAINTSNSVSHKRSASCGPDFRALAAFSDLKHQTSSSQSKPEKGRISNVIAKLMGLDELPQNGNSKTTPKESSSKHKEGMVSKKTTNARTKNAEAKTRDTNNLAPLVIEKKLAQPNKIPSTLEMQVTRNANSEFTVPNGKLLPKDLERAATIYSASGSRKASIAADKQQSDIGQSYQFTGSQNDFQEKVRIHDNTKQKEQIGMEMGDTKQLVRKVNAQKHKILEGANMQQEKIGSEESTIQKEKGNSKRLPPSNQQKPKYDQVVDQQEVLQKSEPQEEKHQAEKREQQRTKQKFQGRKRHGIEAAPKNSTKPMHESIHLQKKQQYMNQAAPNDRSSREVINDRALKGLPNGQKQEDLVRDGSSTNLNINTRYSTAGNSDQNASPKNLGSETDSKGSTPLLAEEKPVHVPASRRKVDRTKVHTSETPRIIDEVITRRNGTLHNSVRPHKQQISVLQEMKQRRVEKTSSATGADQMSGSMSKEAELQDVRPKKSEASIKLLNRALPSNKQSEQPPTLYSCGEAEHQSPSIMPIPTLNENCQEIASEPSTASIGGQDQVPVFSEQEQKSQRALSSPVNGNGADVGNTEISYRSQHEHKGILTPGMQELLTENETRLKQMLIKSQQFLNMAEALFKLNIPTSFLCVTDRTSQDEDSKLILDCAFEVMKRKKRRRELTLHPYLNISIISIKISALDDLVKELHKDFENLNFYGGNGSNECDAADYLHKILERDVQNKDTDVNCMWELGWNEMMFAIVEKEEVIREVERHLLNGLIDEITRDLLHLNVFY